MIRNNLWILGVLWIGPLKAQTADSVLATVVYQFVHVYDTTQRDKPKREEQILYIAKDASFYTSNSENRVFEELDKQIKDAAFDGNLTITSADSKQGEESFYFLAKEHQGKELYKIGRQQYLVEESQPMLKWSVVNEYQTIGGYRCQRANAHFKGRDYVAWFTPELPFAYGPWKLQGLPGLILEASDVKQEVQFKYLGFDKVSRPISIRLPAHLVKTDRAALGRLKEAIQKNPVAANSAGASGQPASIVSDSRNSDLGIDPSQIKSINVKKIAAPYGPVNNPIERSDR